MKAQAPKYANNICVLVWNRMTSHHLRQSSPPTSNTSFTPWWTSRTSNEEGGEDAEEDAKEIGICSYIQLHNHTCASSQRQKAPMIRATATHSQRTVSLVAAAAAAALVSAQPLQPHHASTHDAKDGTISRDMHLSMLIENVGSKGLFTYNRVALCDASNHTSSQRRNGAFQQLQQAQLGQPQNGRTGPLAASPNVANTSDGINDGVRPPSWFRRAVLGSIGVPLPTPRLLTPNDTTFRLSKRRIQRRARDEQLVMQVAQEAAATDMRGDAKKMRALQDRICEIMFGKGVTPQARQDFLAQYGCTGWTQEVLDIILDHCETRGIVEIGAGHGQWARALAEAYENRQAKLEGSDSVNDSGTQRNSRKKNKKFDFCMAYDDMSNLPLNTHVFNPYTQPHHDYFGKVQKLESPNALPNLFRSWACRGRVLLLVYPSPGSMAVDTVRKYLDGAAENDTVIFVGEGRGGANGDDAFFDMLENENWVLLKATDVKASPGDKGYERLYILQKVKQQR